MALKGDSPFLGPHFVMLFLRVLKILFPLLVKVKIEQIRQFPIRNIIKSGKPLFRLLNFQVKFEITLHVQIALGYQYIPDLHL